MSQGHATSAIELMCYLLSLMVGDPYFSFQKQILFNYYLHIVQKWSKNQCGKLKKKFKISVHGPLNPAILRLQDVWNYKVYGR